MSLLISDDPTGGYRARAAAGQNYRSQVQLDIGPMPSKGVSMRGRERIATQEHREGRDAPMRTLQPIDHRNSSYESVFDRITSNPTILVAAGVLVLAWIYVRTPY